MNTCKKGGIDVASEKVKSFFCGWNKLGDLSEWIATVGAVPNVEVEPDENGKYTTYCWCCTLWRGVAFGGILGLIIGLIVG